MICFECSKKYAKPKVSGGHTAITVKCSYCGKVKMCFPDRHFVINKKLVADKSNKPTESKMKTSTDILKECIDVQAERGTEYDADGSQERSFKQASVAFNAITKKDITPAEVCLMLQVLKDVRQWSHPDRLHEDSVLDGVSYASLKAEELYIEHQAAR